MGKILRAGKHDIYKILILVTSVLMFCLSFCRCYEIIVTGSALDMFGEFTKSFEYDRNSNLSMCLCVCIAALAFVRKKGACILSLLLSLCNIFTIVILSPLAHVVVSYIGAGYSSKFTAAGYILIALALLDIVFISVNYVIVKRQPKSERADKKRKKSGEWLLLIFSIAADLFAVSPWIFISVPAMSAHLLISAAFVCLFGVLLYLSISWFKRRKTNG